eukprot:s327_g4.t1
MSDVGVTAQSGMGVEALSDALNIGSILLQGRGVFTFIVPLLFLWLLYLSVYQYKNQQRNLRIMTRTLEALRTLQDTISARATESTDTHPAETPTPADVIAPLLENSLQCIDAKLLLLEKETKQLKGFVDQIDWERSIDKLEKLGQTTLDQAKSIEDRVKQWSSEVPPKIKEIHQFTAPLGAMNKALQALALDCQKQFAMAETTQDGVLRQGREALQYTQSDLKAVNEKLATMDASLESVKTDAKQLSTDLHVAKTRLEQKADNTQRDLKQHAGWVQSNMRGLGVMVPQSKDIQTAIKDLTEYAVLANKHDNQDAANAHQILEAATSTDDRLNRLEAVIATVQDGLTEVTDILQQVKESQALLQDNSRQILERTPKIVKRSPPAEAAGSSSGTPQPSPLQQSSSSVFEGPSHPIRLAEHLQPTLARESPNIFMMQEPNLSRVPTAELLRALMARGNF